MEITLQPETLFVVGSFNFTNSFLTSLLISLLLLFIMFLATRALSLVPGFWQNIVEITLETLFNINRQLGGSRVYKIFPWFAGFFLFILMANLIGLLPGFGTIGFWKIEDGHRMLVPFLRPVNSDLNMTLGLALVSLFATHILSVRVLGVKDYISRFFSLNPVNLFVGILEIIAEITKLISLSFRLFGNIFAGEAVLITISTFFAFILPLPFIVLEIIVGFVQALIFSMLTMVFMVILTAPHEDSKHSTLVSQDMRGGETT